MCSVRHLVRSLAFFSAGALAGCIRTFVIDSVTEKVRVSIATEVFSAWLHAEPDSNQGQADETDGADAESEEKLLETAQPRARTRRSVFGQGACVQLGSYFHLFLSSVEPQRTAVALDSDVTLCSTAVPMCSTIVRYTSSVVGGTIAMFRSSWKMSAFVWPLLVTGSIYGARAGGKTAGKSARQIADARADAFGFAEDVVPTALCLFPLCSRVLWCMWCRCFLCACENGHWPEVVALCPQKGRQHGRVAPHGLFHHRDTRHACYFGVSFLCDWTGFVRVARTCGM